VSWILTPYSEAGGLTKVFKVEDRVWEEGRDWATGMKMTDMGDDHIVHLHRWLTHEITLGKEDLYSSLKMAKDINALTGEIERRGLEVVKAKLGKKKKRVRLFT